ncbi:GIY-YIG nuclease family protein [Halobium salinum]|uniref:GIY-YIG nuclease family protein n=1 Tax=Halobium salinum TaxID=1364940 RepID=A0ABD5PEH8_9EURY|nr:GIY-YIG nuclease family protein [Halobium salinum]
MPINKNWSKATKKHIEANVPAKGGVYELKSFGEQVYVGSSRNLQERLLTHLEKRSPNKYRFETAGWLQSHQKLERKHYTRFVDKYGKPPHWNDRRP